jgi:hypothetical protein
MPRLQRWFVCRSGGSFRLIRDHRADREAGILTAAAGERRSYFERCGDEKTQYEPDVYGEAAASSAALKAAALHLNLQTAAAAPSPSGMLDFVARVGQSLRRLLWIAELF